MRQPTLAVLSVLLLAANPLEGDKFLEKADEKFEQSIKRAQEAYAKAAREAYDTQLKTYQGILAAATKAGDFDRATAIKAKIEEIESQRDEIPDSPAGKKKGPRIPKDAVAFGSHHYALISDKVSWHVAKHRCEAAGGHLACLETPAEAQFVFSLCKDLAWVGASDEEQEGRWVWINGQRVAVPMKADNHNNIEHSLAVYQGELIDGVSGDRMAYVCEWDD